MEQKTTFTLKVAEASPREVGQGMARLHPGDMAALGVATGEVVSLQGQRQTVARAHPTAPGEGELGVIQIDGLIRENTGASLDEKVTVASEATSPALRVALTPQEGPWAGPQDTSYLGRLLQGMAVLQGDRVRVNLFGTRAQDLVVAETSPEGAVVIVADTTVVLNQEMGKPEAHGARITYEDIGGLGREIQRIREMAEMPLKYPEVFERLGIEPPKGVLLHGPPGCGKTLIARAVASETLAHFSHVNGPEVIHKFYGESEAHLRRIFDEAEQQTPSIIFIDEIDAIAPKREEVHGEVEKRVVAQLLALLDGLRPRGRVIVIAATNIPHSLDPALRRPGRFDREIGIGIPDKKGRLAILLIHTRGMPLAPDVDLEKLASVTHGFVGADLEALCREAAMHTLRRFLPHIDFQQAYIPYEELMGLDVDQESFIEALKEVEPSAIREVFTEVPEVRWEEVGGLEDAKRFLREAVEFPLKHPQLYDYAHLSPARGILLHGEPGTGKTLLAKALATESGMNFISVKGPSLISKWVGESEKGVREVFKKARQAAPCIVFLDELDAIAPRRSGMDSSHVAERVVSQLLTEMDGMEDLKGVTVLGATNRIDMVDPALLRPGRFDVLLDLPLPGRPQRLDILSIHTRDMPLAPDVDMEELAGTAQGWTGADLGALCQQAGMMALREFVGGNTEDLHRFHIGAAHFQQALEKLSPGPLRSPASQ
ncbi:MAG: CDC48 family AAA ATPase [Dehalococcoidia bacterium]|nr:CDC48 family AAA ATPase [Dehalococcoidia bacterium]